MTIGQLAEITHLGIDTIRYYEKLKLLPKPKRAEAGYRKNTPSVVIFVSRMLFYIRNLMLKN